MIERVGQFAVSYPLLALGISFEDMVLVASAILVSVFVMLRGRSDVWRGNYEAEKARASLLDEQVKAISAKLAALETKPDMGETNQIIRKMHEDLSRDLNELLKEFREHDKDERRFWGIVEEKLRTIPQEARAPTRGG